MSEFHVRLGTASFMLSEQLHLLVEVGEEVGSMPANKTVFRVNNLLLRVKIYAHIGVVQ